MGVTLSEIYPWGAEAPAKHIAKLQKKMAAHSARRAKIEAAFKTQLTEVEEKEKSLRAEIRAAETVRDKEACEAASQGVAKIVEKLIASGKISADALKDPSRLEEAVLAVAAKAG